MWTFPGKKLLFMGGEIAQWNEWNSNGSIEWNLLDYPLHRGVQSLIVDLNALYRKSQALHGADNDPNGFQWVVVDDSANSVYAYFRRGRDGSLLLIVSNMTPVPRYGYRFRVPTPGPWRELLNTDGACYGGSNLGNGGHVSAQPSPEGAELSLGPSPVKPRLSWLPNSFAHDETINAIAVHALPLFSNPGSALPLIANRGAHPIFQIQFGEQAATAL